MEQLAEKPLTMTLVGAVVPCTIFELSTIKGHNKDGTESDTRKVTGAIALHLDMSKIYWDLIWRSNSYWDGVSSDSLEDIEDIGYVLVGDLDDTGRIEQLQSGVSALLRWKHEIEPLAKMEVCDGEGRLSGLVRYLQERIDAAEQEIARLIGE